MISTRLTNRLKVYVFLARLCYTIYIVTAALQPLINKLVRELEPLVESGANWQMTLHGGRNGHVIIEILRKDEVMLSADHGPPKPPPR